MITFDLETLPTNDAEVIAALEATISAPGQHKKPDSIAEWMRDNKAQAMKELLAKTSFDGMYGRIACAAWSDGDEILASSPECSEGDVIQLFYDFVQHEHNERRIADVFCGHNVHGFDLPFLKHRSIILGIKPPRVLLQAMSAKPWDACIADTMLMWSLDRDKRASMDRLCKALGIAGKCDFDGSMVAETWPVDPQKVIDYCKYDVKRTINIYNRLTFK